MTSLADALPAEIKRVSAIRAEYASLRGMPGVNVEPAIFLMDRSLDLAIVAASHGDVAGMVGALADLRGYSS